MLLFPVIIGRNLSPETFSAKFHYTIRVPVNGGDWSAICDWCSLFLGTHGERWRYGSLSTYMFVAEEDFVLFELTHM